MELRDRRAKAMTLMEVVIGMALVLVAIGALAAVHAQVHVLLRSQKQLNAASSVIWNRMDAIRQLSWADVTSGAKIRTMLSATLPESLDLLPTCQETITVAAYVPLGVSAPSPAITPSAFSVSRSNVSGAITGGTTTTIGSNARGVTVTVEVRWVSNNGRIRTKSASTIITPQGAAS